MRLLAIQTFKSLKRRHVSDSVPAPRCYEKCEEQVLLSTLLSLAEESADALTF